MNICRGSAAFQHKLPADASHREGLLLPQLRSMGMGLLNCELLRIEAECVVYRCLVCIASARCL